MTPQHKPEVEAQEAHKILVEAKHLKDFSKNSGVNITDAARRGEIDPVIGRDSEITRVIEILNRRTKNNPVLIGEPGVGKTAVVEGLAQKIS